MRPEDIATVRKRKVILAQEVAKNGSDVDQWLWDKVNPLTWGKNLAIFPQDKTCLPKQKWMQLVDDTTSPTPVRDQQYGITPRKLEGLVEKVACCQPTTIPGLSQRTSVPLSFPFPFPVVLHL